MGLPLRELVTPRELAWEELAGRTLAVDGYNALYQFLATIRGRDGSLFTDAEGRVTSHLVGLLHRTTSLLGEGVRTVWVFDGAPPALKAGTLSGRFKVKEQAETRWREALAQGDLVGARRHAAATSRLTREMVEEARRLLEALGLPTVSAPSEGEAQAAQMAARGQVWAIASEDYDSLLFGAPRLVRGLAARSRGGSAPAAQVVERERLLAELGIDAEELLLIGLLVGTDYNDGTPGIGPKRALKLVQQHLGWEATLRAAGTDPTSVEPVAELFRHPEVATVPDPTFGPIDAARVESLLITGHGFSPERVRSAVRRAGAARPPAAPVPAGRQSRLERFEEA